MPLTLQGAHPADRLRILENGAILVMERTFPANQGWQDNGGVHLHQRQVEILAVLDGILSVQIGEELRTFVSGERFEIPQMTPHALCNLAGRTARIRWEVHPALNTAAFIQDVYDLAPQGRNGVFFQRVLLAWAYREVYTPVWPPPWAQPVLFAPLAFISRLLGYRVRPAE